MAGAVHIMGKIEAPNITTPTKKIGPEKPRSRFNHLIIKILPTPTRLKFYTANIVIIP